MFSLLACGRVFGAAILFGVLLQVGAFAADDAKGDTKPKATLPAALSGYVNVTATLSKAAEDATVELRTFKRAEVIRLAVGAAVFDGKPDSRLNFDYYLLPNLICDGRGEFFATRSPAQMLATINESLTTLYTDTEESTWRKFIKWISRSVSGRKTALPAAARVEVKDVCRDDVTTFEERAYRVLPEKLPKASLSPVKDAVDGIKEAFQVIEPVLKQALQIVTDAQRRKAVREFFSNDNNRTLVKEGAAQLRAAVKANNERNRAIAFAGAAEAWAKLSLVNLELKTLKPCETFLALDQAKRAGKETFRYAPEFLTCHAAVMASIKDDVDAVLTKAAKYDTEADIGAAAKTADVGADAKFEKMLKNLASSRLKLDEFLDGVGVYINLAIEIEKATSKENRQKIRDAIDKALGKD
jgi:hypothetical protein